MKIVNTIVVLLVLIVIVFVFSHLWVFICDSIIGGLKKMFHLEKKQKKNWHTIDSKNKDVDQDYK